ncbi:arginase family protein [Streptomyces sp. NPDC058335]|uniref:arginase family protein n=1 Tax=Streptomyces sp. NPDC058335 TaxID=3346451 RepID=UPI003650C77A
MITRPVRGWRPSQDSGAHPRDEDVRFFGIREAFADDTAELVAPKTPVVTVGGLREWGAETLGAATARAFGIPELDGFWVHLDADVLDPTVMPAVDSPDPDGLLPGYPTNSSRCRDR